MMNILHLLLVFTIIVFICTFIVVFCWVNNRYFAGSLELAYSLIWGSHNIWGKGGGDSLDLL